MNNKKLNAAVFSLAFAAFFNVYLPQPVLPLIQSTFAASTIWTALIISALFLGIAIGNLLFGIAVDRYAMKPLVLAGGCVIVLSAVVCAVAEDLSVIIIARFIQGFFIPTISSCLAAYLSRLLPREDLNQILGGYVAATVAGGLGGRVLSGMMMPAEEWRLSFLIGAGVTSLALLYSWKVFSPKKPVQTTNAVVGYMELAKLPSVALILLSAAAAMAAFASVFNFLPYLLQSAPFNLPVRSATLFYLPYLIGTVAATLAGKMSNRFSNTFTITVATVGLALSLFLTTFPNLISVGVALLGVCGSFFALHSSMLAMLNRNLSTGHGKANALYVLFYYVGAWLGVTAAGWIYDYSGWNSMITALATLLFVPLLLGMKKKI